MTSVELHIFMSVWMIMIDIQSHCNVWLLKLKIVSILLWQFFSSLKINLCVIVRNMDMIINITYMFSALTYLLKLF